MLIIFSGSGTKFVLAWTVKILGQRFKDKNYDPICNYFDELFHDGGRYHIETSGLVSI